MLRRTDQPGSRKALSVRVSHRFTAGSARFDEDNLVSHAGLVPLLGLAEQTRLPQILAEKVSITTARIKSGAANPVTEAVGRDRRMCAGADSIDDRDMLARAGCPSCLTGSTRPPPSGRCCRSSARHAAPELVLATHLIKLTEERTRWSIERSGAHGPRRPPSPTSGTSLARAEDHPGPVALQFHWPSGEACSRSPSRILSADWPLHYGVKSRQEQAEPSSTARAPHGAGTAPVGAPPSTTAARRRHSAERREASGVAALSRLDPGPPQAAPSSRADRCARRCAVPGASRFPAGVDRRPAFGAAAAGFVLSIIYLMTIETCWRGSRHTAGAWFALFGPPCSPGGVPATARMPRVRPPGSAVQPAPPPTAARPPSRLSAIAVVGAPARAGRRRPSYCSCCSPRSGRAVAEVATPQTDVHRRTHLPASSTARLQRRRGPGHPRALLVGIVTAGGLGAIRRRALPGPGVRSARLPADHARRRREDALDALRRHGLTDHRHSTKLLASILNLIRRERTVAHRSVRTVDPTRERTPLTTNLTKAALSAMTRASRLTLSGVVVNLVQIGRVADAGAAPSTSTVGFDQMRSLR